MSSRQAVVLASRALCVFFIYMVFSTLLGSLFMISETWNEWQLMQLHMRQGFSSTLALNFTTIILHLALELLFAIVFYRCGDRVSRFLLGADGDSLEDKA
jgi:hypothetical protein